jgi:predicted transcriptional regulator
MTARNDSRVPDLLYVLAINLRVRRRALGLTQQQLADNSGVSRACIASIEAADNNPRVTTLASIGKALEVEATELLTLKNTPYFKALLRVMKEGKGHMYRGMMRRAEA